MQRRDAIKTGFSLLGLALAGGAGVYEYATANEALELRPPGALSKKEFLSKCIRCGLCVSACPYDTLKLASFGDFGVAMGTPFFTPRITPCFMCEDIPCLRACPTGALEPKLLSNENGQLNINKAKMGVAVIDEKSCVAYFGVQCDACYRACPVIDKAIFIDYRHNERTGKHAMLLPVIDSDYCTGCGKCQKACITEKSAISVLPRDIVLGKINEHYVKGWIQGDDAKLEDINTHIKLDSKKSLDYLNNGDEL